LWIRLDVFLRVLGLCLIYDNSCYIEDIEGEVQLLMSRYYVQGV